MITTVMARSRNVMPEEDINHRITALGPGWKVVSTTVSQEPWGQMNEDSVDMPMHVLIAVVIVLEKLDAMEPVGVFKLPEPVLE